MLFLVLLLATLYVISPSVAKNLLPTHGDELLEVAENRREQHSHPHKHEHAHEHEHKHEHEHHHD